MVVARCTSSPVVMTEGMEKYGLGQPLVVVGVDHEQVPGAAEPVARSPTRRIHPRPPPNTTRNAAIHATRRRPATDQGHGQAMDNQRQGTSQQRGLDDEHRDREQPGGLGEDGGVEVGEPVVDERFTGEERYLGREIAGVHGLGNGQVDAQVAPVRAAHFHASGREAPQAAGQHDEDDLERGEREEDAQAVPHHPDHGSPRGGNRPPPRPVQPCRDEREEGPGWPPPRTPPRARNRRRSRTATTRGGRTPRPTGRRPVLPDRSTRCGPDGGWPTTRRPNPGR